MQKGLPWRLVEQFGPTYVARDRLSGSVDDYGKRVGADTSRAPNDEVANFMAQILGDRAPDRVFEGDGFIAHAQAPCRFACSRLRNALGWLNAGEGFKVAAAAPAARGMSRRLVVIQCGRV